jgi:hypothetical protein
MGDAMGDVIHEEQSNVAQGGGNDNLIERIYCKTIVRVSSSASSWKDIRYAYEAKLRKGPTEICV